MANGIWRGWHVDESTCYNPNCISDHWETAERKVLMVRRLPSTEHKDPVHHPAHYNMHPSGIECIDIVEHMGFNLGNVVKYVWRADLKGDDIKDLKKAEFYIKREIEKRERGRS